MSISVDIVVRRPVGLTAKLHCQSGQTLGLVGPSGAGKSTVLRAIAGLIPYDGVVRVNDTSWTGLPTHRRRVGLVSQEANLLPHLDAAGNVAMALAGGALEKKSHALAWLKRVNLEGLGERFPHQLSGGQQQRVALARALAREPDVLLLDEPFSSVDATTRRRLYEELIALRTQIRCATILVTHDVKEAALLSDELCVISEQKTLAQGSATEMLECPPSGRVAQLLGWRNVIPADRWAASPALNALYPVPPDPTHAVLVPHRNLRINRAERGLRVTVVTQLKLPHQAWARVQIDGVRLWGTLDRVGVRSEGENAQSMDIDANALRTVRFDLL